MATVLADVWNETAEKCKRVFRISGFEVRELFRSIAAVFAVYVSFLKLVLSACLKRFKKTLFSGSFEDVFRVNETFFLAFLIA